MATNTEFTGEIKIMNNLGKYAPRLIFREQAYFDMLKLMASEHAKTTEFMFSVLAEKRVFNTVVIEDVFLMPNIKCSACYCESDPDKYAEWMHSNYTFDQRKRVRIHAHSHVNMATGPSGTDNDLFDEKFNDVDDYYVQLIINHNAQDTANIRDKQTGIEFKKVPVYAEVGNRVINVATGSVFTKTEDATNGIILTEESIPQLPDGTYTIANNEIVINNEYTYSFKANKMILKFETEKLAFDSITHKITAKISKEELDAVNKEFNEKVKKTYQYGGYGTAPGYNYYDNDIYNDYTGPRTKWQDGMVWDYVKKDWTWPKGKAPKGTTSVPAKIAKATSNAFTNKVQKLTTKYKDEDGYDITIERIYFDGDIKALNTK